MSVSSTTGQGFEDLAKAIDDAKEEYNKYIINYIIIIISNM